jgi:hypothetical protein
MPPEILLHKTDALRRLLHLVSHGYTRYTAGQVDPKKAEALALKFADRYAVTATEMQRYRRKQAGQANAALVLFGSGKGTELLAWWLLVTPGEGLVAQLETLRDATAKGQRIIWPGGDYELVKTPRKALEASWTWRMTPATVEAWEERIKTAIRTHNDEALRQALHSLRRVPGFRDTRAQAFALAKLIKKEWSRRGDFLYADVFVGFLGRYTKAERRLVADVARKARRASKAKLSHDMH